MLTPAARPAYLHVLRADWLIQNPLRIISASYGDFQRKLNSLNRLDVVLSVYVCSDFFTFVTKFFSVN